MIESTISAFIEETVRTQGVTLAAVFVMMAWMMRRINYLDERISKLNDFLMDCLKEHLNGRPPLSPPVVLA
jgi:hypothetical protein